MEGKWSEAARQGGESEGGCGGKDVVAGRACSSVAAVAGCRGDVVSVWGVNNV